MKKLIAMAAPILPGKLPQWKGFLNELKTTRHDEYVASRKRNGVRERAYLQQTPQGDLVIVTLEGEDPESAMQNLFTTNDAFTKWFLTQTQAIHGIDFSLVEEGPLPELAIDSHEAVLQTAP